MLSALFFNCFAECKLSVAMLSVFMMSVVILSAFIMNFVMLTVILLIVGYSECGIFIVVLSVLMLLC